MALSAPQSRAVWRSTAASSPSPAPPPRRLLLRPAPAAARRQRTAGGGGDSADAADSPSPPPPPPPASSSSSSSIARRRRTSSTATTTTTTTTANRRTASIVANSCSSSSQGGGRRLQQNLPRVLIVHTGGTLGMDVEAAFEAPPAVASPPTIKRGAAGNHYSSALRPGSMLSGLLAAVPELAALCQPTLHVAFNHDSSAIGPNEWIALARLLHESRAHFDGFLVIHGTDTLAFTASALSLMLTQFGKPIVLTGSQLPLASPRSDARQNLIDAVTCIASGAVGCAGRGGGGGSGTGGSSLPAPLLQEVAVCFGGRLLRGNRCTKAHSAHYGAFESPSHQPLAVLGVDVEWNANALLRPEGCYTPRLKLEPRVMRLPVVPGCDPRLAYGSGRDVAERGVRGVILEAFGVGNIPDRPEQGWRRFLVELTGAGVLVCLSSQCRTGPLRPDAYAAGVAALELDGLGLGPHTAEAAVAKTMLCCAYPDLPLGVPLAGEI